MESDERKSKFDQFLNDPAGFMGLRKEQTKEETQEQSKEPEMAENNNDYEARIKELEAQIEAKKDFIDPNDIELIEDEKAPETAPEVSNNELNELKSLLKSQKEELEALKNDVSNAKPEAFEHNPESGVKQQGNSFLEKMNDPNFRRQVDPLSKFWAYAQAMGVGKGEDYSR